MPNRDFYQVSLKVILKNKEGEALILNGHPKGSCAYFYDLPGGRIDKDEFTVPLTEITRREVIEEIGNVEMTIDPKPVALGRHFVPASMASENTDLRILCVFFEAAFIGGDIVVSKEHDGFRWVNLAEIELEKFFVSGILEGIRMYLGIRD